MSLPCYTVCYSQSLGLVTSDRSYILNSFMWLQISYTHTPAVSIATSSRNTEQCPPTLLCSMACYLAVDLANFSEKMWCDCQFVLWVKWPLIVFQISREVKWRTGRAGLAGPAQHWSSISTITHRHTHTTTNPYHNYQNLFTSFY